ncbi:MAG: hypothetical protein ACO2PO_10070, partial [Candidatus Calescibacterium sp.]
MDKVDISCGYKDASVFESGSCKFLMLSILKFWKDKIRSERGWKLWIEDLMKKGIMIDKLSNVKKEFVGWDKVIEDIKLGAQGENSFLNIPDMLIVKLSSYAYPSIETTKFPGYTSLIFGFYDLSTIWIMNPPRTEKIKVEYMKPVSGIGEFCSISASQNIPFVWAYDRQSNSLVFLKRNSDWSWSKEEVERGAGWGISSFIFGTIPCAAYLSMVE